MYLYCQVAAPRRSFIALHHPSLAQVRQTCGDKELPNMDMKVSEIDLSLYEVYTQFYRRDNHWESKDRWKCSFNERVDSSHPNVISGSTISRKLNQVSSHLRAMKHANRWGLVYPAFVQFRRNNARIVRFRIRHDLEWG